MTIDVSRFVDINTQIAVGGTPRLTFGTGLLITIDDTLPAGGPGKARVFDDAASAALFFGAGNTLDAVNVWFSANPAPKSLYVGRWASVDVPTTLVGSAPAVVTAMSASSSTFTAGGHDVTVDLSGATGDTYAKIAALIQTAIQALATAAPLDVRFAGATFVYDVDHFLLTLSGGFDIGGTFGTASTGTDVSALLGFASSSMPTYKIGHDAEGLAPAVAEMVALATSDAPVAIMVDESVPDTIGTTPVVDTREALSALAQAGDYVFALRDTSDQALVTGDITSPIALAFGRQQDKVAAVYTKTGELLDFALMATMSAQNLNQPASIITAHAKAMQGVLPAQINISQLAELERKNANVLTNVGGSPSLIGGTTSRSGHWLDAVWWLLWIKNELELNIWNAQRSSRRLNNAILGDTILTVMEAGVRNGGIDQGGGRVNNATKQDIISTTGNVDFDGNLGNGYLTWIDITPSDLDRDNRIGRFKTWIAPNPAIHRVFGDIVLSG